MFYLIGIGLFLLLLLLFCYIYFSSSLTSFENPSLLFRLQYSLYTSPSLFGFNIGLLIHNHFLSSHRSHYPRQSHTIQCTKLDHYETYSIGYIPFLEDNYSYVIIDHDTGEIGLIDPADPIVVVEILQNLTDLFPEMKNKKLTFTTIFCTHKHMDHAGGNLKLKQLYPNIQILSGKKERVTSQTLSLSQLEIYQLGTTQIQLLETPCHTIGHVVFFIPPQPFPSSISSSLHLASSQSVLFSGDILFVGGCGRFFEGDGVMMSSTLTTLTSLPLSTSIYCGHEYTVNNLAFCLLVEPENEILQKKFQWAKERRRAYLPTIPSTLNEEKEYNAFMRYQQPHIMLKVKREEEREEATELANWNPTRTLEGLRRWRNREM